MKTKADYKAAMEYVQDACQKQERVTRADLKEKFGTSLHFLPAMINAGYIERKPGFKYRWRVGDMGVLPIMVRRIQSDITAYNMDNHNKSREAVVPVEPEVAKAIVPTKEQIDAAINVDPDANQVFKNYSEQINNVESIEDSLNEKIARLERNMTVIKSIIKLQNVYNEQIVDALESKPEERKTSIKIFGLPIFSISRS